MKVSFVQRSLPNNTYLHVVLIGNVYYVLTYRSDTHFKKVFVKMSEYA